MPLDKAFLRAEFSQCHTARSIRIDNYRRLTTHEICKAEKQTNDLPLFMVPAIYPILSRLIPERTRIFQTARSRNRMSKGGATKIIGLSGGLSIRMIPSGKNPRHPLFQVLQVQSRSWRILAKVNMWSQISFARPEKKRMQLKKQTPNHSGGPRKVPFLVSKRSPGNTRPTFLPLSILAMQAI